MDTINLLLEYGADLTKKHQGNMNCFDEMIRNDHIDVFEAVYPLTKKIKRNFKEVTTLWY
jgi:hypothetical protein